MSEAQLKKLSHKVILLYYLTLNYFKIKSGLVLNVNCNILSSFHVAFAHFALFS